MSDDPSEVYVGPTQRRLVLAELEHLRYHTERLRGLIGDLDLPPAAEESYGMAVGEMSRSLDILH